MSNIHRFNPRPKAPPPRKRLTWARSAWLPWVLLLAVAVVLTVLGVGGAGTILGALALILIGGWLHQKG